MSGPMSGCSAWHLLPSIRYPSHAAYVEAVRRAVDGLIKERLLLEEDGARFVEAAQMKNPLDPAAPLEPLVTAGRED